MPAVATQEQVINGVPVDRLMTTIEAVKQTPSLGKFNFRSRTTWMGGGHIRTSVQDFYGAGREDTTRKHPFVMDGDEPEVLLGQDRGANAVEFVLHALATCLGTTFVYYAAAQGVEIEEFEMSLDGGIDIQGFLGLSQQVRRGYENIRVRMKVKSSAPDEKIQELCKLAQRRSPVFDVVTNPTPVTVTCERL